MFSNRRSKSRPSTPRIHGVSASVTCSSASLRPRARAWLSTPNPRSRPLYVRLSRSGSRAARNHENDAVSNFSAAANQRSIYFAPVEHDYNQRNDVCRRGSSRLFSKRPKRFSPHERIIALIAAAVSAHQDKLLTSEGLDGAQMSRPREHVAHTLAPVGFIRSALFPRNHWPVGIFSGGSPRSRRDFGRCVPCLARYRRREIQTLFLRAPCTEREV